MNVRGDEGPDAEDDDEELYRDVNINLKGRDIEMTDVHTTQVLEDTHVTLTPVNPDGQQHILSVSSQFVTSMFNPSPDAAVQIQSDRLRDKDQAKNEDILNKHDENIQKIIKDQIKEQVKVQVSKILPKIEKTVNEQLEAKV
nr:hypothetical protein [Tanacetum cinerariifolium]